jgi:hypothetical protein
MHRTVSETCASTAHRFSLVQTIATLEPFLESDKLNPITKPRFADRLSSANGSQRKMKHMRTLLLLFVLTFSIAALGQSSGASGSQASTPPAQQSSQPAPTIASTVDNDVTIYEKLMVDAADAMPEAKFDFTPAGLNIPGSVYKDVRTFAQLIKHTAAANYRLWTNVSGEKMPDNIKGSNGPDELKTKAEIMQLLKDSFAAGHRAAKGLTPQNMLDPLPFRGGTQTRLFIATFGVIHDADEYGQMVEYLRMNGIVPPASRH